MKKLVLSLLLGIAFGVTASAQHAEMHTHGRNEIAISPGAIYSLTDKEWGFGAHLHYFRTLSATSPWAIGGGLEAVAMHGGHYSINVGAKYTFLHVISVSVMPGVTFFTNNDHDHVHKGSNHDHTGKAKFSTHFELSYELIHTEFFHLGPAIDFSWCKGDNHLMIGLHCAYLF